MEQLTSLIQAIGGLIRAIVWPVVVLIAVFVFRDALRGLLGREEVSVSGSGGFALNARGREIASQELVAAEGAKGEGSLTRSEAYDEIIKVESVVQQFGRRPRIL